MPPTKTPRRRPPTGTARQESVNRPHPSRGGTRGWDLSSRQVALSVKLNGAENAPIFESLRQQHLHPSKQSTGQWARRLADSGHFHLHEMSGNRVATVLKGHKLLVLAVFRVCCPKGTVAEVNAFLFACAPLGEPIRFCTESQITEAEHFLGLSRKRASTAACQASLPINLAKRHSFWNDPCPHGIAGTSRARITDWDEAVIFVETTNGGHGKTHISTRCREEGPYNHSENFTLTAAIRGGATGGVWLDVSLRSGTRVMDAHDFLQGIIHQLGQGGMVAGTDNTHTFICDNLTSHKNPIIRLLVDNNQHRLAFRAPHCPVDGPMELFFNHLQQQLSVELHTVRTAVDSQQAIIQICQRTQGQFDRHFSHCGCAP